jgi:GTP cyclohydrolase III
MSVSTKDLATLFGAALNAVSQNRQTLNQLDGFNGNHGDNMAQNLQLIVKALQGQGSKSPADALQHAATTLQTRGSGGSG